ncbi:MAG: ATP-binding protein [Woeseia sp.]
MSSAGALELTPQATTAKKTEEVRGALGIQQLRDDRAEQVARARHFRPGIAVRLISAFALLAMLPIVAAVVGLLSVSLINQSLEELESTTMYFGVRDREFRRGAQILARVYANPSNFDSRTALAQARRDINDALAIMRQNLDELAARGMIEQAGELTIEQRSLEIATSAALQVASQRLTLLENAGQSIGGSVTQPHSLGKVEDELQLRHTLLRDRHESMIGMLAAIDQANLEAATERVDAAQQSLKRLSLGIVSAAGLCTLLALAIALFYVVRNLVRRMERLTISIDRIDAGNLSGPIRVEGDDEIAKMATALESLRAKSLSLREVETSLKHCQRNLDKSNSDRDRFAHAAAHDLRAPLRGIRNIAEFIADDLGDVADSKTGRYLDIMRGRIERLDELLESLLEYTRAGSIRPEPELCSVQELLEESIRHVPPELAEIDVQCEHGEVLTWRRPLADVLRQLIDNAIKHNDHQPARLTLDCRLQRRSLRVRVVDDGPGIEPRHHRVIFEMFQTLQSRDSVEGSGMGLAIAQKLTQSFGGRLLVESDPEKARGSAFLVTWPINNEVRESAA